MSILPGAFEGINGAQATSWRKHSIAFVWAPTELKLIEADKITRDVCLAMAMAMVFLSFPETNEETFNGQPAKRHGLVEWLELASIRFPRP